MALNCERGGAKVSRSRNSGMTNIDTRLPTNSVETDEAKRSGKESREMGKLELILEYCGGQWGESR